MIEIAHLTKRFEGATALDDLTLTVPDGSVYGLVGPNGAGKSTLIRHVAGVYKPDSGSISVNGYAPFDNPQAKVQIQCIYDDVFYYLRASTKDLAGLDKRLYPGFDQARFEALEAAFPEVSRNMPLRQMSRGMVKQCAFWIALSCCPKVLLLDEPVDGLDPVMRRQVWTLLAADVAERGMTVLLSSHNLREIEDICDHVGVLNKGRKLLERNIGDLQDNIAKVQVLVEDGSQLPDALDVLHESKQGKLLTLIVRNSPEQARNLLAPLSPSYLETLPLTLEEIFIYELEECDYAVHDIML